jgi:hypothetical protein
METAVGIFSSQIEARRAVERMIGSGVPAERINLLTPGDWKEDVGKVPLSDTEQPGTAKAIGGVMGGAAGASAGYLLGPLVAGLFVPGVGAISAIGLAVVAMLDDHGETAKSRQILAESGAVSIDAAREDWWIGLKDVTRGEFEGEPAAFPVFEKMYRYGFEAAQRPE